MNRFRRPVSLALALLVGVATSAERVSAAGLPRLDGSQRAAASRTVPLPPRKPTVFELFASGCMPRDAERYWRRLPTWARKLSLEEMTGQLLVISFLGRKLDSGSVDETIKALAEGTIGGVLYFGYNVGSREDLVALNAAFRNAHPHFPALIAIDQEGGAVARLKPAQGVPEIPRARVLARSPREEAAELYAGMAAAMATLGFNVNLAPVVDLDVNPDNPVIARFGRSFGDDPGLVARRAAAFVDAHRAAGIATALKHFPGHGSTRGDSHDGAIRLGDGWSFRELEPYRALIAAGKADMIMVGHLALDRLAGEGGAGRPATLSKRAIQGFLRETLCFDGLIVSDDLRMDAIESRWSLPDAATLALAAGNDLILASVEPAGPSLAAEIVAGIARAAADDPVLAERIRHAYARVATFKLALGERYAREALEAKAAANVADRAGAMTGHVAEADAAGTHMAWHPR